MRKLLFGVAVALAGLTSCDLGTTKVDPIPVEISYYSEYHYCQYVFSDVVSQALTLAKLELDNPSGNADPDGVTITLNEARTELTIVYKESMTSRRIGKIVVTFTGTPLAEGSSMLIHPDGLTYSGVKVIGDAEVTILPKGTSKAKQQVIVRNGALTDSYNVSVAYACNLTREQKEGDSDKVDTDDTFTFTGSATGTLANKSTYNVSIIDPLVMPYGSSYFKSGKLSMTPLTYTEPFYITFGTTGYINQILFAYQGLSKLYTI
ncbi:hypothetical protein [uncultured Acetobacteroides sp.]|uniref:hypothetical protein n=1 Tax=uncultured Acetobacteroides sp. TaxID=1760811 RepID=UPI0029F4D778|nr:hypothetical protein [uncultured Acetobacteroides sp.]